MNIVVGSSCSSGALMVISEDDVDNMNDDSIDYGGIFSTEGCVATCSSGVVDEAGTACAESCSVAGSFDDKVDCERKTGVYSSAGTFVAAGVFSLGTTIAASDISDANLGQPIESCFPCPVDMWQDDSGSTSCKSCTLVTTTSSGCISNGCTICTTCKSGEYMRAATTGTFVFLYFFFFQIVYR